MRTTEIREAKSDELKETQIGLIPTDWELVKLADIFDVQQGKAMSPQSRSGIPKYPFLRTLNVLWGRVDLSTLDHMHFTAEEMSRLQLRPDDLLVCEGGEVGRTAIWKGEVENCAHQNHVHRLRKRRGDVWPEFYMYWMQAAFLQLGLYAGEGIKTTIPNLSMGRLQSFILPKPSFAEQQKIALVLTRIQRAIEQQDKIIEATRNLKKSLVQKLFTEGIGHTEFKGSEIGQIPKSWQVMKLHDSISLAQYGLSEKGDRQGQYPIIRMKNLENGVLSLGDLQYVNLDDETLQRFRLAKGDILFNRTNSIDLVGKTSIFDLDGDFVFASYLIRLRTRSEMMFAEFLNYYMNWSETQQRLKGLATRAVGQSNISATRLRTLMIPLPPVAEQLEIANTLRKVSRKINAEEKSEVVLRQLFKTLLHKLMTGELRVKDLDLGVSHVS